MRVALKPEAVRSDESMTAGADLSLRTRPGRRLPVAWQLLSRLFSAPPDPALPFGLGCRFVWTPLGNGSALYPAKVLSHPGISKSGR